MNLEKILSDIDAMELQPVTQKEKPALEELNRLNKIVYGTPVYAGCSNCHIKAFKLLKSLTLLDLTTMTESKFKIKKTHLIEWPFRGGTFYSAGAPMPNDIATEYLAKHPANIVQFETYPGSDAEVPEYTPLIAGPATDEDLEAMDKKQLQAEYLRTFGEKPKTKDIAEELLTAIKAKNSEVPTDKDILETQKAKAEKAAFEKSEADRIEVEKAAFEKSEADRIEAEKAAQDEDEDDLN